MALSIMTLSHVVWQTLKDYCFRVRLYLLRPYRKHIRELKREAENLKDELYQRHLVEEMRKNYQKDREAAMLVALNKYKQQKELQKAFRETLETSFSEKPGLHNPDKETENSLRK